MNNVHTSEWKARESDKENREKERKEIKKEQQEN